MKIVYLIIIAILASCTPKQNNMLITDLPQKWQNARLTHHQEHQKKQHWWQNFNDSNLDELINVVLKNNYDLKIAKEKIIQARSQEIISTSFLLPKFNATHSSKVNHLGGIGQIGAIGQNQRLSIYQSQLDASYEIDVFGKNYTNKKAANKATLAASADFAAIQLSLIAQVASQYVNFRFLQESEAVLAEIQKLYQKNLSLTLSSYKAGILDKTTLLSAQNNLHQAKYDFNQNHHHLGASYLNILALIAQKPSNSSFSYLLESYSNQLNYTGNYLPALPASVIAHRPDVIAAEQRFLQAANLEKNAITNLFPLISISALLGRQNNNILPSSSIWQVNAITMVPILNWLEIDGQIKQAKSLKMQNLHLYQQSVNNAILDVEDKLQGYYLAEDNKTISSEKFSAQQSILAQTYNMHQAGLISKLDEIKAEIILQQTKLELINARKNLNQNAIALAKALAL